MIKIKLDNNCIGSGTVVLVIMFVLALAGSTKESSQYLIDGITSILPGSVFIEIPAVFEVPIIAEWIGIFWFVFLCYGGYVQKFKSLSPQIFANGLTHSMPYRGAASIDTEGNLMHVRGNGSAAPFMPSDGCTIVCAPSSHCFISGEHLIIDADLEPRCPLSSIPFEIKSSTFNNRKGLDKISDCAIGWVSKKEIENNKSFKTEGDKPSTQDLKSFILEMDNRNESIDRLFELRRYEIGTMKNDVSLVNRLTKEGFETKKNTIFNKFWGQFE